MKIIFPTGHIYPSRGAHARHTLEMARSFNKLLNKDFLFIICKTKDTDILKGIDYKESRYPLFLKKIKARTIFYLFWLFKFFLSEKKLKDTVLFLNDRKLAHVCIILRPFFGYKIIFECHGINHNFSDRFLVKNSDGTVFTTQGLVTLLQKECDFSEKKYIVLPNAVDLNLFEKTPDSKDFLREKLALPKDKVLIGYIGRFKPLGFDKGINSMMDALSFLPENISMCFIGGVEREIAEYEEIAKDKGVEDRCIFQVYVKAELVPFYMKAMDILALTPPANEEFFVYHTSPMKMFEYMASKRPIISSELPALKEILDEETAVFIKPADSLNLAEAVKEILRNPELGKRIAEKAFLKVQDFTWEKRGQKVIEFSKTI